MLPTAMVRADLYYIHCQQHSLKSFPGVLQLRYDLSCTHAVDFRTQVVVFTYMLLKIILLTLIKFKKTKILGSCLTIYLL